MPREMDELPISGKDRRSEVRLVSRGRELGAEDSFESPLLVLIVQQHNGCDVQRPLAAAASRYLALKVLNETIREMVRRPGTPR